MDEEDDDDDDDDDEEYFSKLDKLRESVSGGLLLTSSKTSRILPLTTHSPVPFLFIESPFCFTSA